MTLDDRLRRALAEFRDDQSLDPDALGEIRRRGDAPERRGGGPLVALSGAVLVVLLALLVVVVGRSSTDHSIRGTGPAHRRGVQTVAAFGDGSIQVLDGSGRPLRTIVDGVDPPHTGPPTIAVSADGRSVYFDRQSPNGDSSCVSTEVARVSIDGGVPNKIVYGAHPVLSPRGRYLAVGLVCSPTLIVWDLVEGGFQRPQIGAIAPATHIEPVAWSPDGTTLLVDAYTDASPEPQPWLVGLASNDAPRRVAVGEGRQPSGQDRAVGFFGSTDQLVATDQYLTGSRATVIDATSGAVQRTLFTIRGSLRDASVLLSRNKDAALVFSPSPPETAGLYRWQDGERRAKRVADHRGSAVVVAAAQSTKPNPSSHDMPARLVVVRGGRLQVLSSTTGRVVRTLVSSDVLPQGISVGPDRRVFFSRGSSEPCAEDAPEIGSVAIQGGAVRHIGFGFAPQVSPNGRTVAFEVPFCDDRRGTIYLTYLDRKGIPIGTDTGPNRQGFPQSWSPDASGLLFDNTLPSGVLQTSRWNRNSLESSLVPLPENSYLAFDIGDSGYIGAARQQANSRFTVIAVNPETGKIRRTILVPPDQIEGTLRADSSGRHLLFVTLGPGAKEARLWRWSPGERATVLAKVSSGGLTAAWIDDASGHA